MEESKIIGAPAASPLIKLSASSTKTFEQCRRKYRYTYIDKLPKKDWPHLILGTFCHAVLEQMHVSWTKDKNLVLVELMSTCFADQRAKFLKLTAEQLEDAKNMLQGYLHYVEKNGMPNTIAVEEPFTLEINKYFLRGFIDRIDMDKDGVLHIKDYKSSKSEKYLDNFQLLVYALALKNKHPDLERVRGSYIMLRQGGRLITEEFNVYDIRRVEQKIINFGTMIETEQKWEKSPSQLCNWCDFYTPCMGNSDNWTDGGSK